MSAMNLTIGLVVVAATVAPVQAIDTQQTTTPTTASAEVTQCAQARMVVDQLLAAAMVRMDAAKQANTAADLRAAVDSLQNTMRDVRARLAACVSMPSTGDAPMDHSKMPMAPATKPAAGGKPAASSAKPPASPAPMDHSKMPMAPATKPAAGGKPAASSAKPPVSPAPMDHSKMSMGEPADGPAQATDPVCGLKVDPVTAPKTSHQGKTYYFCSEQHRELFQKMPTKYLPKAR